MVCEYRNTLEKMKTNQGSVSGITGLGLDENGLERKNPVIVALGADKASLLYKYMDPEMWSS